MNKQPKLGQSNVHNVIRDPSKDITHNHYTALEQRGTFGRDRKNATANKYLLRIRKVFFRKLIPKNNNKIHE